MELPFRPIRELTQLRPQEVRTPHAWTDGQWRVCQEFSNGVPATNDLVFWGTFVQGAGPIVDVHPEERNCFFNQYRFTRRIPEFIQRSYEDPVYDYEFFPELDDLPLDINYPRIHVTDLLCQDIQPLAQRKNFCFRGYPRFYSMNPCDEQPREYPYNHVDLGNPFLGVTPEELSDLYYSENPSNVHPLRRSLDPSNHQDESSPQPFAHPAPEVAQPAVTSETFEAEIVAEPTLKSFASVVSSHRPAQDGPTSSSINDSGLRTSRFTSNGERLQNAPQTMPQGPSGREATGSTAGTLGVVSASRISVVSSISNSQLLNPVKPSYSDIAIAKDPSKSEFIAVKNGAPPRALTREELAAQMGYSPMKVPALPQPVPAAPTVQDPQSARIKKKNARKTAPKRQIVDPPIDNAVEDRELLMAQEFRAKVEYNREIIASRVSSYVALQKEKRLVYFKTKQMPKGSTNIQKDLLVNSNRLNPAMPRSKAEVTGYLQEKCADLRATPNVPYLIYSALLSLHTEASDFVVYQDVGFLLQMKTHSPGRLTDTEQRFLELVKKEAKIGDELLDPKSEESDDERAEKPDSGSDSDEDQAVVNHRVLSMEKCLQRYADRQRIIRRLPEDCDSRASLRPVELLLLQQYRLNAAEYKEWTEQHTQEKETFFEEVSTATLLVLDDPLVGPLVKRKIRLGFDLLKNTNRDEIKMDYVGLSALLKEDPTLEDTLMVEYYAAVFSSN